MTEEYERYKKAIARIYRASDGAVVGSGILVFERYVLTCAHVVADALDIDHTAQYCPQDWVELDFPIPAAQQKQKLKAKVVFWQPICVPGIWKCGDDIAGLELEEELADEISPVGLAEVGLPRNIFHALGFPIGYDDGVWTYGEFRNEQGTGWVQITVTGESDYFVEGGFSGAPVWDDTLKAVAGMIVSAEPALQEKRTKVKVAFMIPTKVLIKSWNYLQSKISQSNEEATSQDFDSYKVANLLMNLNYDEQKINFKKSMNQLKPGAAFLVRARDIEIQRWLVSSLSQIVPGYENSERITINASRFISRLNPDLWQEFGKKLLIPKNIPKNRDTLIRSLAEICQKKSVIIAVYNFPKLREQIVDLHQFWCDLLKEVKLLAYRNPQSRLILFLTDDETENYPSNITPFQLVETDKVQVNDFQKLILLAPLSQLTASETEGWFISDPVFNLLGEEKVKRIVEQCLPFWQGEPLKMLNEICAVFDFEGIAEIEPYWKLAG